MLSIIARVSYEKQIGGMLDDHERKRLDKAMEKLSILPIYIDDTPYDDVTRFYDSCVRMKMKKDIGLLIVDNIYFLPKTSTYQLHARAMPGLVKKLSDLAKEQNVLVIATMYLNRLERRKDKRPRLIDLPAHKSTEKYCDAVILLYRDDIYWPTYEETGIEVHVVKNKNGGHGVCELAFYKDNGLIT